MRSEVKDSINELDFIHLESMVNDLFESESEKQKAWVCVNKILSDSVFCPEQIREVVVRSNPEWLIKHVDFIIKEANKGFVPLAIRVKIQLMEK